MALSICQENLVGATMTCDHAISLFSGAGGMSLGFAQAGIKPILAADIDPSACRTYETNLHVQIVRTDISQNDSAFRVALRQFHEPLALVGGPPCQGFSSAGRKSSHDK